MFFALLGCALQVAAATPSPLSVLFGDRKRVVPVVVRPDGARAVRADLLADAIGGAFVADGGIRYHLQIAATRVDLEAGSASVAVGTETYLISSPVYRQSGRVFVSLTFATDLLPRLTNGLLYDHGKRELRRFGSVTARSTAVPAAVASTARDKQPSRADDAPAKRQRVVVVDAGHGGVDRGMTGPLGASHRVFEKDITLAVARELRGALERRGIAVVMTRATDTLIALGDRGKIANQAKGDLFISIHVNAANPGWQQPSGARGYETYFLAEAKTEDERRVEAMENEVIKFETTADATRDDPLGFIIRDMAQNEHLRESSRLAEIVQDGLKRMHPGPSRGVKQAGFMVLVKAFMPAVLVEVGFGSNRAESAYMTDATNQRALGDALASAAEAFLAQYQRKVTGSK